MAKQLKDSFRETHQQENFFFDGVNSELSSQRVVLRCRFYNHDKRAIVTLKVLVNGRGHEPAELQAVPSASLTGTLTIGSADFCLAPLSRAENVFVGESHSPPLVSVSCSVLSHAQHGKTIALKCMMTVNSCWALFLREVAPEQTHQGVWVGQTQGGQVIKDGVGRGSEVEDDVDPKAAREYLSSPDKLLQVDLPFIKELQK